MGYYYNGACSVQTCSSQCCNYNGLCPNYYSRSSYDNQCWYYYNYYQGDLSCSSYTGTSSACCYNSQAGYYSCTKQTTVSGGTIGGIVGGVVGGFIICVFLMIFICRRYRNQQQQVAVHSLDRTTMTPNISFGSTPVINHGPSYGSTPAVHYGGSPVVNFEPAYGGAYPSNNSFGPVPPYISNGNPSPVK